MSGISNYFVLTAKAKTGLGPEVIAWSLVALVGAVAALIFLILAGYIVLANAYSPLTAALVLAAAFLLVAILAAVLCLAAQRRIAERSRVALAARTSAFWFDPKLLSVGVDAVRAIGLKRLVPLAAIGILAGGLAREWIGHKPAAGSATESGGE
jgi:hypothetical protein